MVDAVPERPGRHSVLRIFTATLAGRPEAVLASVQRRLRPGEDAASLFAVDPEEGIVVAQGGWWYRGEWRVVAEGTGSRITYEIVNVACRLAWAVPLAGRAVLSHAGTSFAALVRDVSADAADGTTRDR